MPSPSAVERQFKVYRITNGTVIDHIPHWQAFKVIEILGVRDTESLVTAGFGLPSGKFGRKDLLKIENFDLTEADLNRIALVAPQATINIIRNSRVVHKFTVRLPEVLEGLVRCPNLGCITRHEPVPGRFHTLQRQPVLLRCHYCQQLIEGQDLELL
jgi:aspartate carbamoyltransferase regulatory subunit